MIDKTNLRIETVNEYCIVDEKNQIIKDGFCSEEEAAKWLEDAYGIKHEPKLQPKIGGWIPCSERLPEESLCSVIGWDEYRKRCCFVQYLGGRWILGNDIESVKITHWQPVPTAPYEVKSDE